MSPQMPVARAWIDPFEFGPDSEPLTLPRPNPEVQEADEEVGPITEPRPILALALAAEMHLAGENK